MKLGLPETKNHVFVGGPLHGQCWTLDQLGHLGPKIEEYAMCWEVATGSQTGRLARVWRYIEPA